METVIHGRRRLRTAVWLQAKVGERELGLRLRLNAGPMPALSVTTAPMRQQKRLVVLCERTLRLYFFIKTEKEKLPTA